MHEEKIALVDGQVKAVQQARGGPRCGKRLFCGLRRFAGHAVPGQVYPERETAAVSTGAYTAAEFLNDPPRAWAKRAWWCSIPKAAARRRPPRRHGWPPGAAR